MSLPSPDLQQKVWSSRPWILGLFSEVRCNFPLVHSLIYIDHWDQWDFPGLSFPGRWLLFIYFPVTQFGDEFCVSWFIVSLIIVSWIIVLSGGSSYRTFVIIWRLFLQTCFVLVLIRSEASYIGWHIRVALSDTHVFILNEYFIELNTANFNILNIFLN